MIGEAMKYKFFGGPLDGQEREVDDNKNEYFYREDFPSQYRGGGYFLRPGMTQGYSKVTMYRLSDRMDDDTHYVFKHESLTNAELEKLVNQEHGCT